jgi:hypothetical protein
MANQAQGEIEAQSIARVTIIGNSHVRLLAVAFTQFSSAKTI